MLYNADRQWNRMPTCPDLGDAFGNMEFPELDEFVNPDNSTISFFYISSRCLASHRRKPVFLNVSCQDASLRGVLRAIAVQHGVSLAGLGAVLGTVAIHLDNAHSMMGWRRCLNRRVYLRETQRNLFYPPRRSAD
jgi:hypothetical protein